MKKVNQKYLESIKQYKDPYWKIQGETKTHREKYKKLKAFFKREINSLYAYPKSKTEEILKKEEYYEYVKLVHYLGLKMLRPPYWFRNVGLNFLLKVYEKWKSQANLLKQDYYLKLWLYERDFSQSQIVFGLNNKIKRYNSMFESHEKNRDINFLTKDMQNKLLKYNIQYCKEVVPLQLEDLEEKAIWEMAFTALKMGYEIDNALLTKKEPILSNLEPFIELGFIEEAVYEDENFYLVHADNVWILEEDNITK